MHYHCRDSASYQYRVRKEMFVNIDTGAGFEPGTFGSEVRTPNPEPLARKSNVLHYKLIYVLFSQYSVVM
jgi:hypothetical protein